MLKAKTQATYHALSQMTAKEKEQYLSSSIIEDYNKLRTKAIELKPEIEEIAPPVISYFETEYGMRYPNSNYSDIRAYYQQLASLLV